MDSIASILYTLYSTAVSRQHKHNSTLSNIKKRSSKYPSEHACHTWAIIPTLHILYPIYMHNCKSLILNWRYHSWLNLHATHVHVRSTCTYAQGSHWYQTIKSNPSKLSRRHDAQPEPPYKSRRQGPSSIIDSQPPTNPSSKKQIHTYVTSLVSKSESSRVDYNMLHVTELIVERWNNHRPPSTKGSLNRLASQQRSHPTRSQTRAERSY